MLLNEDNFKSGFLLDEELMAGVSESPDAPGEFFAFVLRHTTGEYLGHRSYGKIQDALEALNSIPRDWKFETSSGCGSGNCGKSGGQCKGGSCGLKKECCNSGMSLN